MNRRAYISISLLLGGALLCAAIEMLLRSGVWAFFAMSCAAVAIVIAVKPPRQKRTVVASARPSPYTSTSSATVAVREAPRAALFKSSDSHVGQRPPVEIEPDRFSPVTGGVFDAPQLATAPPSVLPAGSTPREVVECLMVAARAAGNPIAAHLWLEDAATSTLRLVEAQGESRPKHLPISIASGLLGDSLAKGTAQLDRIDIPHDAAADRTCWRYALPLTGSDLRGIAAIDFEGDHEPDRGVLTTISATLRPSLSGTLALHVARADTQSARILVDTCAQLARALTPDEVLRVGLHGAMSLAQAQTGSIMLLDPSSRRLCIQVAHGLPEEVVSATDIPQGDGIAGWVLATKRPQVIEDLRDKAGFSRRHGVCSAICVPLAYEEDVIGVLNVGCRHFHARSSSSHLDTLDVLGRVIAVALHDAEVECGARDVYLDTLRTLVVALEECEPYARGSVSRVIELAEAIGARLGIKAEEVVALRIAAMLHDVGMHAAGTSVPITDQPLSTIEWGMLKMHPVIAAEIMSQSESLVPIVPIVYHHHEHFDGTGYVSGIAGTNIPLGARILAVCDAYVAMTSTRPYRPTLSSSAALEELQRWSGSQFDPDIVTALVHVVQQRIEATSLEC